MIQTHVVWFIFREVMESTNDVGEQINELLDEFICVKRSETKPLVLNALVKCFSNAKSHYRREDSEKRSELALIKLNSLL